MYLFFIKSQSWRSCHVATTEVFLDLYIEIKKTSWKSQGLNKQRFKVLSFNFFKVSKIVFGKIWVLVKSFKTSKFTFGHLQDVKKVIHSTFEHMFAQAWRHLCCSLKTITLVIQSPIQKTNPWSAKKWKKANVLNFNFGEKMTIFFQEKCAYAGGKKYNKNIVSIFDLGEKMKIYINICIYIYIYIYSFEKQSRDAQRKNLQVGRSQNWKKKSQQCKKSEKLTFDVSVWVKKIKMYLFFFSKNAFLRQRRLFF